MISPSASEVLRAAGLRVTAPRTAVYEAVALSADHPDVEHIADTVRTKLGRVSVQTVYDTLSLFARANLVRIIDPAGSTGARFELQTGDNHHHLVCRDCFAIVDVPCHTGSAPCMHPVSRHGFDVEEAEVVYWGRCAECQTQKQVGADDTKERS